MHLGFVFQSGCGDLRIGDQVARSPQIEKQAQCGAGLEIAYGENLNIRLIQPRNDMLGSVFNSKGIFEDASIRDQSNKAEKNDWQQSNLLIPQKDLLPPGLRP